VAPIEALAVPEELVAHTAAPVEKGVTEVVEPVLAVVMPSHVGPLLASLPAGV
jgi:hypothetical protein